VRRSIARNWTGFLSTEYVRSTTTTRKKVVRDCLIGRLSALNASSAVRRAATIAPSLSDRSPAAAAGTVFFSLPLGSPVPDPIARGEATTHLAELGLVLTATPVVELLEERAAAKMENG
jgi:hypothetical protein